MAILYEHINVPVHSFSKEVSLIKEFVLFVSVCPGGYWGLQKCSETCQMQTFAEATVTLDTTTKLCIFLNLVHFTLTYANTTPMWTTTTKFDFQTSHM